MEISNKDNDCWMVDPATLARLAVRRDRLDACRNTIRKTLHRLSAEIMAIEQDATLVGKEYFDQLWAAHAYYAALGYDAQDVNAMIDDGTVKIGRPHRAVRLDQDGRWWVKYRVPSDQQLARLARLSRAFDRVGDMLKFADLEVSLQRIAKRLTPIWMGPYRTYVWVGCITDTRFERKLPYCPYGRPHYGPEKYQVEHDHPDNSRMYRFEQIPELCILCLLYTSPSPRD